MSRIEIIHRGYPITFSENESVWRCWDLDAENMDLTKVKAAIDRELLKVRKDNATPAMYLDHGGYGRISTLIEGTITEYQGAIMEGRGSFGTGPKEVVDHKVGFVAQRGKKDRASKRCEKLSGMIRPGADSEQILQQINALEQECDSIEKRISALKKSFPRLTVEDISALVKIAEDPPTD